MMVFVPIQEERDVGERITAEVGSKKSLPIDFSPHLGFPALSFLSIL